MRIPSTLQGIPWDPTVRPLVSRAIYVELAQSLVCQCPPGTSDRRCPCLAKPSEASKRWSTRWISEKVLLAGNSDLESAGIDRFKSGKRAPGQKSLTFLQAAIPHSKVLLWGNHPLWHLLARSSNKYANDVVRYALVSLTERLPTDSWFDAGQSFSDAQPDEQVKVTVDDIQRAIASRQFDQLSALDQMVCGCALAKHAQGLGEPVLARRCATRTRRSFERAMFDNHQLFVTWPLIGRLMEERFWQGGHSPDRLMAYLLTKSREQLQPRDGTAPIELPVKEAIELAQRSALEVARAK